MMMLVFLFAVFIGCFHANVAEITIAEGSLATEGSFRITTKYEGRITFSLTLMNSLPTTESVKSHRLDVYLSNDPSLSLKSREYTTSSDTAFPIEVAPVNEDGTVVTDLTTVVVADYQNCDKYSYFCVVYDSYRRNGWQCINVRDNIVCPEIVAYTLTITNPCPSSINYLTTADTEITFQITGYKSYDEASVADVKLYFTNGNDVNGVSTTYKSDGISVVGMTTTDSYTPKYFTLTPLVASPKVDVPNCAHYTHLCAVLVPVFGVSSDNDACISFGTNDDQAGNITCPDPVEGDGVTESDNGEVQDCDSECSGCSIHGNMLILIGASILAMHMVTIFKEN
ncbi:uncharacterized protein LOC144450343 [Glandiceps talaboti]